MKPTPGRKLQGRQLGTARRGAPLAMLCTSPACLQRFFKTTTASRPPGAKGATVVIGASGDHGFLRDPVALRSFVHDALKYALAASM